MPLGQPLFFLRNVFHHSYPIARVKKFELTFNFNHNLIIVIQMSYNSMTIDKKINFWRSFG